jgi:uncharacterized cysteine cluster protein YcgN (CxxCxxCC family)
LWWRPEANLEIKKSLLNAFEVIKKGWRCRKLEKQQNSKSAIRRIKNKKTCLKLRKSSKPEVDWLGLDDSLKGLNDNWVRLGLFL